MEKVIQYNAIRATDANELIELVTKFLAEGWQPLGSPYNHAGALFQTMVMYEGDQKEEE
jgi:hypothetical protein